MPSPLPVYLVMMAVNGLLMGGLPCHCTIVQNVIQ
jgi:hypothetical protein